MREALVFQAPVQVPGSRPKTVGNSLARCLTRMHTRTIAHHSLAACDSSWEEGARRNGGRDVTDRDTKHIVDRREMRRAAIVAMALCAPAAQAFLAFHVVTLSDRPPCAWLRPQLGRVALRAGTAARSPSPAEPLLAVLGLQAAAADGGSRGKLQMYELMPALFLRCVDASVLLCMPDKRGCCSAALGRTHPLRMCWRLQRVDRW